MTRTIPPERIDAIRRTCKTQQDIIVAFLWYAGDWLPTHELMSRETPFGFIGSAGHVRVRELARSECAERLKGKVERARGGEIGRDARYEYFRFRPKLTPVEVAAERVRRFDAGLGVEEILAT